jgi:3-isopropylmalate/(R)-2-methylmalate dehydratase small subunit
MTGVWQLEGRCYRLGDNVPHPGGVVPGWVITGLYMDPKDVIPHLFAETDPGFHERCRPGDIIVTGRNFGMGPKMNGYIAMQALGLGLVCESMPFLAYRAAIGVGLNVMTDCAGIGAHCATGDLLAVDFATGRFVNRSRGIEVHCPPIPASLREVVELGGNEGWLRQWRQGAAHHAHRANQDDRSNA